MKLTLATLLVLALIGCKSNPDPATEAKPDQSMAMSKEPKRVAGLEPGWELAPRAAYSAKQSKGKVIIQATGNYPTAGYEVKLVQSMLRIWPPQYMLAHKKPDGIVAQVLTPFEVTANFNATDPVKAVIVTDVAGRNEVNVDQARD